jgi:integrase
MAEKRKLTDRALASLKPARAGQRYEVMDEVTRGFGVRVYDSGRKSFFLATRYPGSSNPTRRSLGEYPTYSLAEARERADQWRKLIRDGKDPKIEEEGKRLAERRSAESNFTRVAEEFLRRHVKGQRRAYDAERAVRKHLIGRWGDRDVTGISRSDVVAMAEEIAEHAPYMAHNVLGHARSLFNWAINRGTYGLESSPCDRVRPTSLIGQRQPRQRVLTDPEIKAFWAATETLGYPFRDLYRLLLLTGVRLNEASSARSQEFDIAKRVWTVPPERFKSNASHLVPLSDPVIQLLDGLPRFSGGDYLFSFNHGKSAVASFDRQKAKLDCAMGDGVKPWVVHDLRRTVRTRLASLRVPDMVAEMVLGHGRKGLQRVYDQHTYEPEMREALELWAERLRDVVSPHLANVSHVAKA